MDGGRRLLRSVNGVSGARRAKDAGYPASLPIQAQIIRFPAAPLRAERETPLWLRRLERWAERWHNGLGLFLSLMLVGSAGLYGAVRGGQYQDFIASNGSLADAGARLLGFGISAVTITSQGGIAETQILKTAGINPNSSLPFLDAEAVRTRLMSLPIVADAQVRKLYPDRLVINITQRQPYALWQKDGEVSMVSQNGIAFGPLTDAQYAGLPFVAGEGANEHLKQYLGLLDALGDLKSKFRAGVYVGNRRWNLQSTNDIEVRLPEDNPQDALKTFAELERQYRILEKDVVAVDLRVPGKVQIQLTDSGMATLLAQHPPQKRKLGSDI